MRRYVGSGRQERKKRARKVRGMWERIGEGRDMYIKRQTKSLRDKCREVYKTTGRQTDIHPNKQTYTLIDKQTQ